MMSRAGCAAGLVLLVCAVGWAAEITVEDFSFEGPLGSAGAAIEQLGRNHFRVALGHAPEHPDWNNKLQFTLLRNAQGNDLTLEVTFEKGRKGYYTLNEYAQSWSYDGMEWHPVHWEQGSANTWTRDVLHFPTFEKDWVVVGHQVPMSYEDVVRLVSDWEKRPCVKVHVLGKSLGGRNIYRVELTDPESGVPRGQRWTHYFANQHPGEHNAQWRMAGMVDWLLSESGRDCLGRSICHFVLMSSPDAPSHGWYRVNAQGVDMNRSYCAEGADREKQAHEAYIVQRDLEQLMAGEAPPVTVWSMHTWGGKVDPRIIPGPELGTVVGTWEALAERLEENDLADLVRKMERWPLKEEAATHWTEGPHLQFGVTAVLCEGAGALYTQEENMASGLVLMQSIAGHYSGLRRQP